MGLLNEIPGRPKNEKPYILMVVGHPADDATIPEYATIKNPGNRKLPLKRMRGSTMHTILAAMSLASVAGAVLYAAIKLALAVSKIDILTRQVLISIADIPASDKLGVESQTLNPLGWKA
ncbi:hypothetical protein [Rhizobium leguminosarum]|uniref:hypothetical protein n=1 Tax=Rhizobium leguminosarum TaxID=384 RepID=UPI003F983574